MDRPITRALLLFLLLPSLAMAAITPGGRGMLFGPDHAFFVTAAPGWVLDNENAVSQGVHMAFYPEGSSWSRAVAVAYGRSISLGENGIGSIDDLINATLEDFRRNGSPNYRVVKRMEFRSNSGQRGELVYYAGDQWGNFEAVGYFAERKTINSLVFTARTREAFDTHLPQFRETLGSYRSVYLADDPTTPEFDELAALAQAELDDPRARAYEIEAAQSMRRTLREWVSGCAEFDPGNTLKDESFVVEIRPDGIVSDIAARRDSRFAHCFAGVLASEIFPRHALEVFHLHLRFANTDEVEVVTPRP